MSKKPTEVRMGKGKGAPEFWVCRVKPGRIMFEIDGVTEPVAREALRLGAAKLPIKTRFVARLASELRDDRHDSEVRGMTPDQLNDELIKLKKEQFNLRFQKATGQLENTARVREVRRDIARIKTVAARRSAPSAPK